MDGVLKNVTCGENGIPLAQHTRKPQNESQKLIIQKRMGTRKIRLSGGAEGLEKGVIFFPLKLAGTGVLSAKGTALQTAPTSAIG